MEGTQVWGEAVMNNQIPSGPQGLLDLDFTSVCT